MNKNNIKIMKTKHFLMALALPAVFAACTADDFVTGQPENPNLANRTVVGNISFVSPDVANTRLIWDNGLKWTETDKLGAALMDERKGGTPDEDPTKNYTIVDKLYSNYRYDYVNGSFVNGNAQFVEGNYFVYAQYNAEQTRTGLAYSIPTNQEDGTDGRDSWYKNQMWLDHIFVEQGDKNVEVNPIAVFPVVAFKAMYEGTNSGVEIRKVVVTDGTGKFAVNGTVQPSTKSITYDALKKLKTPSFAEGSANDYKISGDATLADVFNLYKKAIEDYGTKYTTESPKKDIVNPNITEFFVATDVEKSSTLTLNYTDPKASVNSVMVVPQSAAHSQENLKFEIYTNKGIVTISGTEGTMSKLFTLNDKKDYTTVAGDELNQKAFNAIRYNDGFKNAFLTAVTAGQMEKVEIGFKDDAILVPATLTVSDTEELKYYLTNWYAGKKGAIVGGDNNTVTINAVPATGKTVDIDNEVLTFMANAANPSLKFEGIVTIPAETSADALDKIVKGTSGDLNVVNNAVLAWTDKAHTFTAITNNATLTIGQNDDKSAEKFTGELTNLGTLTLYANVTEIFNGSSTSPINNTATLNLNKGTVTTLTNHAVLKVNGTVTVTGLTNNNELTVVKGTLTTGTGSVNNHAITVSEGAEWTVSGNFDNTGSADDAEAATIENNGTITVTGGTFNNKKSTASINQVNAKITNNGQIACSGEGSFTNSGDMDANANSITLITTNETNAEVVVADGSAYINVPTNNGKITFIVTEQAALKAIPSSANSLRITATIDLKDLDNSKGGIKYIEFRSDKAMTITCNATSDNSKFDHVIFNGGSAASPVSFVVKNDLTANKTLEVKKNARVTIENTMTFTAAKGEATGFINDGSLLIIGTLDFSGIAVNDKESVNLGTYLFAGGSADTNITWKST